MTVEGSVRGFESGIKLRLPFKLLVVETTAGVDVADELPHGLMIDICSGTGVCLKMVGDTTHAHEVAAAERASKVHCSAM